MDFQQSLGVKSYCFREFKAPEQLAKMVRDCGVDKLDISRCHIDFNSVESQKHLLAVLRDAGIAIVGLGVVPFKGEGSDRDYFEFCRRAGCDTISINFEPANWEAVIASAGELCRDYSIRCAIHNHGGHHWLGNRTMVNHVLSKAGDWLGLCLDTAWAIDAGEDPIAWAESAGSRLFATHLKDFSFDRIGKESDEVLGRGALDLGGYLKVLAKVEFDGPFVIEYEGDAFNPVPKLKECVEVVRAQLG